MGFLSVRMVFISFLLKKGIQLYNLFTYTKGAVKDRQITLEEWEEISQRIKKVFDIDSISS